MKALLTLLAVACAAAQSPTATVSGVVRVHGTNEPLPDAEVVARTEIGRASCRERV